MTTEVKAKLDIAVPPKSHKRSAFIRTALASFLRKPTQALVDRPHLRGREKVYAEVCAILRPDQIAEIKTAYPEVSVSIVIQAAVASELRKTQYKNKPATATAKPGVKHDRNQDADDNEGARGGKRNLAAVSCI